jgi:hypothetical protein
MLVPSRERMALPLVARRVSQVACAQFLRRVGRACSAALRLGVELAAEGGNGDGW